jgi:hypothetical protein
LKKDLCRTIKPKKRSSLWNISSKKDHSIETEIFRVKQEYIDGELARIASNMALTQKRIDELQVTLLKEAEKGIERHEKYMKPWRDKLIRKLPAHSRALCYQFTDLFK